MMLFTYSFFGKSLLFKKPTLKSHLPPVLTKKFWTRPKTNAPMTIHRRVISFAVTAMTLSNSAGGGQAGGHHDHRYTANHTQNKQNHRHQHHRQRFAAGQVVVHFQGVVSKHNLVNRHKKAYTTANERNDAQSRGNNHNGGCKRPQQVSLLLKIG